MQQQFFQQPTETVARELLGCELVHDKDTLCRGRIVETEAYLGADDPASHASGGETERNSPMYGPGGRAYIYICYGIHTMFNVTTATEGEAGAVLVRAVEPLDGIDRMRKRRNQDDMNELCSGPGKLCEAFGIQKEQTGTPLTEGALRIEDGAAPDKTTTDTRIGVSGGEDMDLRYLVPDSDYLSRQPRN